MRRISVSTALFDGYPFEQAFDEIATAGAHYVEPAFIQGYVDFMEADFSKAAAAKLRRSLEGAGLSVVALSAHMDLGLPETVEMLLRRLAFAEEIGAEILISNSSNRTTEAGFWKNIGAIARACDDAKITLALENLGHGVDSLITDATSGAKLIRKVDSASVRLNYDFGNVYTCNEGRQPAEDFPLAAPLVAHGHLKDVQETADGGWAFCAIGDGLVNYRAVAPKLAVLAPHIPLSLELPMRLRRPYRADPQRSVSPVPLENLREALRRSLDFVHKELSEAA
jgi:sugar phosphate isomerase/epimerase